MNGGGQFTVRVGVGRANIEGYSGTPPERITNGSFLGEGGGVYRPGDWSQMIDSTVMILYWE